MDTSIASYPRGTRVGGGAGTQAGKGRAGRGGTWHKPNHGDNWLGRGVEPGGGLAGLNTVGKDCWKRDIRLQITARESAL